MHITLNNPYTFTADGDQYLAVIPPYKHVWKLVCDENTKPGPLYYTGHRFLSLAPGDHRETFFIYPLDANQSVKLGVVSFQDEIPAKLVQDWSGTRPFAPYIIPMTPNGDLDFHLFDGEPDGTVHTGITLYGDKKVLPRHLRESYLSKQQYHFGDTRKRSPLTWYKAGPGLICGEQICVLSALDLDAQGYIQNIHQLYY